MDEGVSAGLLILRVIVGIVMFAHGYNHVFRGGKIEGTGRFESLGMKPGKLHAWLASPPGRGWCPSPGQTHTGGPIPGPAGCADDLQHGDLRGLGRR
jgi:uncharacterized membrane protein YphA (DoxX/SURF4 family)